MDEIKNPALKAFEEEAAKPNPLLAMTKTQIGRLMADGALLASIKERGVTSEALSEAVVENFKVTHAFKPNDFTDLSFKFDSSKNGFHVNATFRF